MSSIRLIIAGFFIVCFSFFGQTVFLGYYMGDLRESFNLSYYEISNYYAIGTISAAFIIIFFGKVLDRYNEFSIVFFSLISLALGLFLATISSSAYILLLCFFLLRLGGSSLMPLTAVTLVNRYIDKNKGQATSYVQIGWPVLTFCSPLLAVFLKDFFKWEEAWSHYVIFILAVLLPFFILLSKGHIPNVQKNTDTKNNDQEEKIIRKLFTDYQFYLIALVLIMTPFFITSIMFFQERIANDFGISHERFIMTFAFFALSSILGNIAGGIIIDKTHPSFMLIIVPIAYIVGLAMFIFAQNMTLILFAMCIMGSADGASGTISGPLISDIYGIKVLGTIKSILYGFLIISTALAPVFTGYLLDLDLRIQDVFRFFLIYATAVFVIVTASFSVFKKHHP